MKGLEEIYYPSFWYFMWLYQLLKYFPGRLEVIATAIIPTGCFIALLTLPFIDNSPERSPTKRPIGMSLMLVAVLGIVLLTVLGLRS